MERQQLIEDQLADLARHLGERREIILNVWHLATKADPELTTMSVLSRSQLYDHLPGILEAFERHLCLHHQGEQINVTADQRHREAGHGLQRWQQGYQLREVMREWRHLHLCLMDELENYDSSHPELEPQVMVTARHAMAQLCGDGVCESAAQYASLQQAEAASRVRDLEIALSQLKSLERQRAEAWREAAHDLRGNVGVVKNVTAVLNHSSVTETEKAELATILQTGVESLHALLEDLMSLARLEAGHERRDVAAFDAAAMCSKLCLHQQPVARERGLFLKSTGPTILNVEGDGVKTRRIVQNLLVNALKYTEQGGVHLTWGEDPTVGADRWVLCVQDTGPGFQTNAVTLFARVLKQATEEAQLIEEQAEEANMPSAQSEPAPTLRSETTQRTDPPSPGEGIGLMIVKRLCDMLDATLELETEWGRGSTFRVIFPTRYTKT